MKNLFLHIKRDTTKWSIALLTIVLFITIPVFTIFINLFYGPGETWSHLVNKLLPNYVSNSFILIVGTSFLTLLFGISSAWIVSRYKIPLRKTLEWLLILPLAIPSYITAYAYAGIFDYGGVVEKLFNLKIDMMNHFGLIFVLSISLYPYVYVASRAFFLNQSSNIIEASKLLGASEKKTFFKLILPLARPAFIGGLILVLMEVLNDYGAAKYYGINTFTTGIFRAWFSLEEPDTAIYLSAILVLIIFVLITLEKQQRKRIGYFNATKNHKRVQRESVTLSIRIIFFVTVFIPVLLGFLLPLFQLLYWAYLTFTEVFTSEFLSISLQSLLIALSSAFVTVLFALSLLFFAKWNRLSIINMLTKFSVLGYAIPGAVIAVGVLIPTLAIDKWVVTIFREYFNFKIGFILNGTILALVYAYTVRYLAVAYNPIEASTLKLGKSLSEASKLLRKGNIETFFKIEFPLLKSAILSAFILVFVDVMKELPLTLILKPYHINTLAVKAYEYASDELIAEAALPSLFIIFTGVIPVLFLNRLIAKEN
ncbi:ABC transporter permease [Tenacibaculum holothuriorum]|uniref:ABC transporter permease n=1 Tax=Tenacibaculum holothuriorum TaxID=1635173 RepID=A0A1Y2PG45_9FLAO|nr:iron ABC transporter permease [Tenacibaculum holothuriorum]OSY89130.1 ABC transporter permease [Tenacibaculum holothuriorum]